MVQKKIPNASEMIIHDVRRIVLIQEEKDNGPKAAQRTANHSNMITTLKHYLDAKLYRINVRGMNINV
jgi:hypothetical protein